MPLDGALSLSDDWNRLNAELFNSHPLYDSVFINALLGNFASGREKLFVHSRKDVDGLLILRPEQGKWVSFAPSQAQVVPLLVRQAEDLRGLRRGWALEFLKQDTDARLPAGTIHFDQALTINVRLEGDFDSYWNRFPSKTRQEYRRRFKKAADTALTLHQKPEDMAGFVARFGAMEQAGWKGQTGTAVGGAQQAFYTEVMTEFARRGQASAYELLIDGTTAAMQLAIHSQGMLVLLKTTYDEARRSLSPGRLMQYRLLEREFQAQRFSTIEFYTDAKENDLDWATGSRRIQHHLLPRNALIAATYRVLRRKRIAT